MKLIKPEIAQLLETPGALPGAPKVLTLILEEMSRDEPDISKISSYISADPVMFARVLQLANSAMYQVNRPVISITDAASIVGLNQIYEIVLAASVASSFSAIPGFPMLKFWRYSLNVAKLTRQYVRHRHLGPHGFAMGLLSAIGKMIMYKCLPEEMAEIDQRAGLFSIKRAAEERASLGYCYANVGAGFIKSWGIPVEIANVIDAHEDNSWSHNISAMSCILRVASWRSRIQELDVNDSFIERSFPLMIATKGGLTLKSVMEMDIPTWTTEVEASHFSR